MIRYVAYRKIEESLLGLIRVHSITGQSLCEVVEKQICVILAFNYCMVVAIFVGFIITIQKLFLNAQTNK